MRYVILLLLISALPAFPGACTTVAAGNWSAQTTWGSAGVGCTLAAVGGIPGNTDTVTIRHAVVVDVNTTVGDSPSANKTAPGAVLVQWTNGTTAQGTLAVANNVVFTVRGDIRMDSGVNGAGFIARFSLGEGSHLKFDSSAATSAGVPIYRIYSVDLTGSVSQVWATGTLANPFLFSSVTTGRAASDYHQFIDQNSDRIDIRLNYGELDDCGSLKAGVVAGCLAHAVTGAGTDRFEARHLTLTNTAGIKTVSLTTQSPVNAADYFVLDDVKTFSTFTPEDGGVVTDARGRRSFYMSATVAKTTATREVKNCYFDRGANFYGAAGFVVQYNVFDEYAPGNNAVSSTNPFSSGLWWDAASQWNVFRRLDTTSGSGAIRNLGDLKDLYYYMDAKTAGSGNPHGFEVMTTGDTLIDGFIFDYGQSSSSDPNGIAYSSHPTSGGPYSYTYTFKNMLMLPVSGSLTSTKTSSILLNSYVANPPNIVAHHNTAAAHNGDAGSSYVDEASYAASGAIDEYKSNLIYALEPTVYSWWYGENKTLSVANAVNPAGANYNACFGCTLLGATDWTAATAPTACAGNICTNNSTTYNVPMTGTVPGANDVAVTEDPGFPDIRRSLKTWCDFQTSQAQGTCTADDAFALLAADTSLIDDMMAWVRDGFRPTNEAYRGAAHDGGDIGAVPMAAVASSFIPTARRITSKSVPKKEYFGLWVEGRATQASADLLIADAQKLKVNMLVVQFQPDLYAAYRSCLGNYPAIPIHAALSTGFDSLQYLIDQAHAVGIEVHMWASANYFNFEATQSRTADHVWTLHGRGTTGNDSWSTLMNNGFNPSNEASGSSLDTGRMHVDPGHPDAFRFVIDRIISPLSCYKPDGIMLDYIRYPISGGNGTNQWGYNQASVDRYNRVYGLTGSPAGTTLVHAAGQWGDWRREQVANEMRSVFYHAKELQPNIKISASPVVWGNYSGEGMPSGESFALTDPYLAGFVDWHDFLVKGHVDFLSPFIYRNEYIMHSADGTTPSSYDSGARIRYQDWLNFMGTHGHGRFMAPGMGTYINTSANNQIQMARALAAGSRGTVGFRYGGHSGTGASCLSSTTRGECIGNVHAQDVIVLGSQFYPIKPTVPDMPWVTRPGSGWLLGDATVGSGAAYLNDRVTVTIKRYSDNTTVSTVLTDAIGFWGATVPPGAYTVTISGTGISSVTSLPTLVHPGRASRVDLTVAP